MRASKRIWTRAEKSLLVFPILIALTAVTMAWWQKRAPICIPRYGDATINSLEFSPDSQRLAVGYDRNNVSGYGSVFDLKTASKICDLQLPPPKINVSPLSWSPDGTRIVTAYDDGTRGKVTVKDFFRVRPNQIFKIALWDVKTGTLLKKWPYASPTEDCDAQVYFSCDGRSLVGRGVPPAFFAAATSIRSRRFEASFPTIGWANFNAQQSLLALVSDTRRQMEVRDVQTNRLVWQPRIRSVFRGVWAKNNVLGVKDSKPMDSNGDITHHLLLWDGNKRRVLPSLPIPTSRRTAGSSGFALKSFALNDTAPLVAVNERRDNFDAGVTTSTTKIVLWNYQTRSIVWSQEFDGFSNDEDIAWSPDGQWLSLLVADGERNQLWILDAKGKVTERRTERDIYRMKWAPDSRQLAVAQDDSSIKIVRVK